MSLLQLCCTQKYQQLLPGPINYLIIGSAVFSNVWLVVYGRWQVAIIGMLEMVLFKSTKAKLTKKEQLLRIGK